MKKAILIAMLLITSSLFAQKDQVWLGIGGDLFSQSKPKVGKSVTTISPRANGRYMFTDQIGIDGEVGFNKTSIKGSKSSLVLGAGGRYYYWKKDKMDVDGGVDVSFNSNGSAIDLRITAAELEYHPMENGALFAEVFYKMADLGDASKDFGVGLGVKIRFK